MFGLSETAFLATSSTNFLRLSLLLNLILSLSGFFFLNNISEKRGMAKSKEVGYSQYVSKFQTPKQFSFVLSKAASSFPFIEWVLRHTHTHLPPFFDLISLDFS